MRLTSPASVLISTLLSATALSAQQPPRDSRAILILHRSLSAMGGAVPADSVANGTVVVVAGSTTDTGTVRILTRGATQTAEYIQTPNWSRAVIYSRGLASELDGGSAKRLQLELAATSHCPDFPLPFIASALRHPDTAFEYLGLEALDNLPAHHIRFWNTFSSQPKLQRLAEFSATDIWVDAASGLPRQFAYERREGGGAAPRIPVAISFTDYRNVGGFLYPFLVQKSLNGTPWTTITIQSVTFNSGLTTADFPVQ